MSATTRPNKVKISEDVIFEALDGEAVLLDLNSGTYFSLNKTGTVAWSLIEKFGEIDFVKQTMVQQFGSTPPDTIERDLENLVNELLQKGLLVSQVAT